MEELKDKPITSQGDKEDKISRKSFFKYAGGAAASAVAVGLYGCSDDDNPMSPDTLSIAQVNPSSGKPGDVITITGMNFSPTKSSNEVTIGGKTATIQSASSTELSVVVPDGLDSGKYDLQVTVAGSTVTYDTQFMYDMGKVDLGSGDIGVLNLAYALEQLESAFYAEVVKKPYGYQGNEERIFTEIAEHEKTHSEWFKKVLGDNAIQGLTPTFEEAGIDFNDRKSVLSTAKALEDTGVGAYNGAGPVIKNPDYLVEAGKIVSVEARHASAIRDLINPNSADFAGDDIVNPDNGLDTKLSVSDAVSAAEMFIKEDLNASNVGQ